MSRVTSPVIGKSYGLATVCQVWRLARSGVYRRLSPTPAAPPQRCGPTGAMTDAALTAAIRAVLAASPFHGEGHRKVWARLRHAGTRTSLRRVLRLGAPPFRRVRCRLARGLKLRHDHGSQYARNPLRSWSRSVRGMSDHFQKEITFLGIESSPAFLRAPDGNGCPSGSSARSRRTCSGSGRSNPLKPSDRRC
jgi:hypothetical protein